MVKVTPRPDPMDPDDRKVLLASGTWTARAYNAHERTLIEQGKPQTAKAN